MLQPSRLAARDSRVDVSRPGALELSPHKGTSLSLVPAATADSSPLDALICWCLFVCRWEDIGPCVATPA